MIEPVPLPIPLSTAPTPPSRRASPLPTRRMGGLDIAAITGEETIRMIEAALDIRAGLHVAFVNAHCVNVAAENPTYREAMVDMLCLPDGIGVDIGSRMLFGEPFPENLNGTDFLPRFFHEAKAPLRVGLVGGEAGIADRAALGFGERFERHRFIAISDGYFEPGRETANVLDWIRLARIDVLLVGTGVPRQELFMAAHIGAREAPVSFAVGALLDFTAGKVVRAPAWMRRLRMEWVWRLVLEPRRLAKRYIAGNPAFLARIARQRIEK